VLAVVFVTGLGIGWILKPAPKKSQPAFDFSSTLYVSPLNLNNPGKPLTLRPFLTRIDGETSRLSDHSPDDQMWIVHTADNRIEIHAVCIGP
jgi:hypothetical protein